MKKKTAWISKEVVVKQTPCPFGLPLHVGLAGDMLLPHKRGYVLIDGSMEKEIARGLTIEHAEYIASVINKGITNEKENQKNRQEKDPEENQKSQIDCV